jgi:hypothetical protein
VATELLTPSGDCLLYRRHRLLGPGSPATALEQGECREVHVPDGADPQSDQRLWRRTACTVAFHEGLVIRATDAWSQRVGRG